MKYLTNKELIALSEEMYEKIKDLFDNQPEAVLKMVEAMLIANFR